MSSSLSSTKSRQGDRLQVVSFQLASSGEKILNNSSATFWERLSVLDTEVEAPVTHAWPSPVQTPRR